MSLSPEEQLVSLRLLTQSTGMIHQAQVDQLEAWPRVVFPAVAKGDDQVTIDEAAHMVTVTLKAPGPLARNLMEVLGKNVRWLLGDDWGFRVVVNGRQRIKWPATIKQEQEPK
jgi:hypothetical protein